MLSVTLTGADKLGARLDGLPPAVVARGGGVALTAKPRVQIMSQRASYTDLERWTAYADTEWAAARAALNAASGGR